jgi:hypothetical protein
MENGIGESQMEIGKWGSSIVCTGAAYRCASAVFSLIAKPALSLSNDHSSLRFTSVAREVIVTRLSRHVFYRDFAGGVKSNLVRY